MCSTRPASSAGIVEPPAATVRRHDMSVDASAGL